MSIINHIKLYWQWIIAATLPITIFFIFYPNYIIESTFFWLCIITLPLSIQSGGSGYDKLIFRLAIFLSLLSLILPTVMGIYLVVCLALIYLLQSIAGRINYTLIVHILLASPLFIYVKSLLSFPIRLKLSMVVSTLLQLIGMDVRIEGNMVYSGDSSFLVDEACAGMFMLGYGLLFGTIILSLATKNKNLPIHQLVIYYILLLALIFLANIVRITLLILFQIMPDQWMHEGLGLFIYVFQILIPFYYFTSWGSKYLQVSVSSSSKYASIFPLKKYGLLFGLLICIVAAQQNNRDSGGFHQNQFTLPGFKSSILKGNITKLQSDKALIYIKPPVAPYRADHNPMICWLGSGYEFKKIEKWSVDKVNINHAELVKGEAKIYTAWWFVSKNHQTGDQLNWRKLCLMDNENFYLINVTCNTKETLNQHVHKLLRQNIISQEL